MTESILRNTVDTKPDTDDEEELLGGKKNPTTWVSHPIDIRVSLPLLHRRFYVTVVAGQERRRRDRRKTDREEYPLLTVGNVFFSLGVATLFTLLALGALIAQSAIIE